MRGLTFLWQRSDKTLVLSYLELRQTLGVIGIALPIVLAIGRILFEHPDTSLLASISAYYYSSMGNVFVGSLCAIGVFLWTYRGYMRIDAWAGHIAGLAAIGVALFPTTPAIDPTPLQSLIGGCHLLFATCFFAMMAFFSLKLFRMTNPHTPPTPRKKMRNKVYAICGWTIIVALILIFALHFLPQDSTFFDYSPTFWLESIAVEAFGISWLVKGEALLGD